MVDKEKVWVILIDQTSHNIPLSQSLIQNKSLTFFNFLKAERNEEASEEMFEDNRSLFMRFKEKKPTSYHKSTK